MIMATCQDAVDAKRVDINPVVLLGTPRGFMGMGAMLETPPDVALTEGEGGPQVTSRETSLRRRSVVMLHRVSVVVPNLVRRCLICTN